MAVGQMVEFRVKVMTQIAYQSTKVSKAWEVQSKLIGSWAILTN